MKETRKQPSESGEPSASSPLPYSATQKQPLNSENSSNGYPEQRLQSNYDAQKNSDDNKIDCSGPSLTRQEYGPDADINNIIARFGIDAHLARQPLFGEVDFDRGLQHAFEDIARANYLHQNLPEELRTKYQTRGKMLEGLANGDFATDLEAALKKRNAPNLQEELTWLKEQLTVLRSSSDPIASAGAAAAASPSATPRRTEPPSP